MASGPASPLFPTTRWTLLRRLREGSPQEARQALDQLCRAYWRPLYGVARLKQLAAHDAQDAVQGFFECLLRRDSFLTIDQNAGRLRSFLLTAFDNFCGQQWYKSNRQKRGGGVEHVEITQALEADDAERHFLRSGAGECTVEAYYNREWACSVLERSLHSLRENYARRGWQERFDLLAGPLMAQDEDATLQELAKGAGMSHGALRVNLHRMRAHFREHIERELAATLDSDDPALIQEELAELLKAFGTP